jgi:hypothetical protein
VSTITRWIAAACVLAGALAFAQQDGWRRLDNGKDFTGWKIGGDPSTWTIKDGAFVSHGPTSHLFYDGPVMTHKFQNFELKVDVMTEPHSNGGVYFDTEFQDSGFPKKGFEVQVNNTHSDPVKTGSLYHVKDLNAADINGIVADNQWFEEDITVMNKTVTIKLNGHEMVSWTQPENWQGTRDFALRRVAAGTIALQGHDPNSTVYYKNIRIRPM